MSIGHYNACSNYSGKDVLDIIHRPYISSGPSAGGRAVVICTSFTTSLGCSHTKATGIYVSVTSYL